MVSEHGIPKDHGAPSINFNQFLEKEKLKGNGSNFTDWFHHVRIFLTGGSLQYVLDAPLGPPPPPAVSEDIKNVYETRVTRYSEVQCAILCSLEAELQKCFEHHDPCDMMRELKLIFETHAAVESYEASKQFFSCMMEEGSSVSEHMFAMSGHAKKLSDMGMMIPNQLGIHRVLQSLPPSYKNFVMNYNMQNMNKDLPELFSMLKSAEVEIKKENQVLMVNKTTSFKKQGKPNKGNFKKGGKKVATHPEKPKAGPKPETVCYYCQGKGHWKRNCSKYLADLKSGHVKKKGISDIHVIDVYLTGSRSSAWVFDTGSVAHICNSKQELRNKRSLARDEVTMRVGNGSKATHSGTPGGTSGQSSAATTSTSASEMAEEPVKYEDLPPEHKKKYDDLKAILEADLIGAFEKTRSHGIKFKGFQPEGALEGLDLSLPSDERTRALRQEINYAVAHSLHRHSESLVNTLERVALNVVQEIMKHKYSPSGPALGTHQGEIPLYTRPPLPYTTAAPQQQGSPAYVVYKVGGDPGDYQFLYEPPKEIPHGYVCTYVPDCNNWMTQVTAGRTATAGGVAGAGSSSGADAEKQAWLTKYATSTSHERSTSAAPTVDEITAIMRDQFGILPKKRMIGYSKPYPNDYDLIPLPPKYRLPDFTKFSGSEGTSSIEHVSRYLAQLGMVSASDELRVRLTSYEQRHPELYQDKFKRVALIEMEEDEDSAGDQEVA
ncbi:hypothetical protein QYE76_003679 [Lolium multiflorum]|uniref:CCHC-type domain-containing protein n=1 Tax=Lolium multiflorum TaxID=4521 RepID=A0AAD8RQN3_LOLMU|nr:hypothetical protein QYE76_003679 [Lolium multiflorum]